MSQEPDHGGMHMHMPMPMPPGGSMSNNTMNMNDMMMMHMSFYWGKDAIILFQGWPNHSLGMYILALFFVFLLAFATEVLSVSPAPAAAKPGNNSPMVGGLTQAAVYALRKGLAYMVMLSLMSFNLGVFMVAVAGHAIGFFLIKCRALAVASPAQAPPKV